MGRDEHREQMRCQVERLLATDLGVAEWCTRNKVPRQTMYYWLSYFAENEPELFGGKQNIVSCDKRRWVESTRRNMAASKALVNTRPAEVVIVDSAISAQSDRSGPCKTSESSSNPIRVEIKGVKVSIPSGAERSDIENVLGAVACL